MLLSLSEATFRHLYLKALARKSANAPPAHESPSPATRLPLLESTTANPRKRKSTEDANAGARKSTTASAAEFMPGTTGSVDISPETLVQFKKELLVDLAEVIRNEAKKAVQTAISDLMGKEIIDALQRDDVMQPPASSACTGDTALVAVAAESIALDVAAPIPIAIAPESPALESAEAVAPLVLVNMEIGKGRYRVEYHQPFGKIPKQLKGNNRFQHNIPSVTLPELGDFTSCLQVYELVHHPDCPLSLLNTRHKQYWTRVIPKGQKGSDVLSTRYRNLQRCLVAILNRKAALGGTIEEACADMDNDQLYRNKDNSVSLSKIAATSKGSSLPPLGMEETFKTIKKTGNSVNGKVGVVVRESEAADIKSVKDGEEGEDEAHNYDF